MFASIQALEAAIDPVTNQDDGLPMPVVNYKRWAEEDRRAEQQAQRKCGCKSHVCNSEAQLYAHRPDLMMED